MKTKIFVTVGSTYPLDRLIKEIDIINKNKKYEIFAQIGKSEYNPKNINYAQFLDSATIQNKINWSDLVISHAGAGIIIDVLSENKKLILFPRLRKYNEAVDNHQVEIANAFKKKYQIKFTLNEKRLAKLIKSNQKGTKVSPNKKLIQEIKNIINN